MDFAGPVYYKRGKKERKAYITLFTCATTRAVHLEVVEDMTAVTFRKSLKNFMTRRGVPKLIISDNAKTFHSTAKWLKTVQTDGKTNAILEKINISWRFNLSKAPWWGGFFERMVGLVKRTLKKSLGRAKLSLSELTELMLDVEFCINNRPLTYQGEDLEMEPLTPNHLIHGRRMKPIYEEANLSDEDSTAARRRLRYLQRCKEQYWKRWNSEYLRSLREHHRITGSSSQIEEGDIVLIKAENQSRNTWKLGKVVKIIKGKDNVIRGVRLQTMTNDVTKYLERPLQHVYPLELREEPPDVSEKDQPVDDQMENTVRPKRQAARKAREEMQTRLFLDEEDENQID